MAAKTERILPVGVQDFPKIRENGYIYADKTRQIYRLISGVKGAFFLSRPRRFGKSLLCSTLGAIFDGRRELFGEIAGRPALAIDGLDWEWKKHPVIHIDLSTGNYSEGKPVLNAVLQNKLENCALPQKDRPSRKADRALNRPAAPRLRDGRDGRTGRPPNRVF